MGGDGSTLMGPAVGLRVQAASMTGKGIWISCTDGKGKEKEKKKRKGEKGRECLYVSSDPAYHKTQYIVTKAPCTSSDKSHLVLFLDDVRGE